MLRKILLPAIFFLVTSKAKANVNDSILINQLVKEIAAEQMARQGQFVDGMFYSYRRFAGHPQKTTPDENIFFTAIVSFALKNMLPWMNTQNKETCTNIIKKAAQAYPYFQNKNKLPMYYFWQKSSPVLPHSNIIRHTGKKLAISEDADDTVMIMMTNDSDDSTVKQLKQLLDAAANGKRRFTKTTYKKYKHIPAHTTYFGKNMVSDFDFSVQCNVLYFMLEKKLPLNKIDSATIFLLQQMIKERRYATDPIYISPYYVRTPILLYHIARLMGKFSIPELDVYKPQLIADIKDELLRSTNIMTDIILSTSLLRLKENAPALPIEDINQFKESNQHQFVFYQARAGFIVPNPFKRVFLNFSMLNYHFFCPAYNKTLLLEYLVERNKPEKT